MQPYGHYPMHPEAAGSGGPPPPPRPQATFPNNPALVNDISNAPLLKELLPALEKFSCLDAPVYKGKRSPWVRAFCELYHPAGPWGGNKFRNVPNQESKLRYNFKSYKIPKILELLEKCEHLQSSEPHKQLYNKLKDFTAKEIYYNQFVEACKDLAIEQTRKPRSEWAPIPKTLLELTSNAPVEQSPQNNVIVTDDGSPPKSNHQDQGSASCHDKNNPSDTLHQKPEAESNGPEKCNSELVYHDNTSDLNTERVDHEASFDNDFGEEESLEENPEHEDPSEAIQEQGSDSNSQETPDTSGEENGNEVSLNAEKADEASSNNNSKEREISEATTDAEAAKNAFESATRNETPSQDDAERSGEKRNTLSSSEVPSPKRQRLEPNQSVSDESQQASSPDPKQTSSASAKVISPDSQSGALSSSDPKNLSTATSGAVSLNSHHTEDREELLTRKREKLIYMLKLRESRYGEDDRLIIKLHEQVEQIDEELMDLIMAEE